MSSTGSNTRYELIRKIARGGMGEVYLARQIGIGGFAKDVVLKRIHETYADDAEFVTMFLQEARIAALLDHPNIVQIYGLGQQERSYFIVMEYVPGLSLSRLLKRVGGPMPYPIAVQVAADVAAGLQFAHDKRDTVTGESLNLVHRDVSPPNVLVSTSGSVKITDFGIAKVAWSANKTRAGVVKGKHSYLAPEQVQGQPASRQTDLYSLGLNLYEMTTGQRAYPTDEPSVMLSNIGAGKILPPEQHVPDYPRELRAVLMRALAVDPAARYAQCSELQEDLLAVLVGWGITMTPAKVGQFVQETMDRVPGDGAAPLAGGGAAEEAPGGGGTVVDLEEAQLPPAPGPDAGDGGVVEMSAVGLEPAAQQGVIDSGIDDVDEGLAVPREAWAAANQGPGGPGTRRRGLETGPAEPPGPSAYPPADEEQTPAVVPRRRPSAPFGAPAPLEDRRRRPGASAAAEARGGVNRKLFVLIGFLGLLAAFLVVVLLFATDNDPTGTGRPVSTNVVTAVEPAGGEAAAVAAVPPPDVEPPLAAVPPARDLGPDPDIDPGFSPDQALPDAAPEPNAASRPRYRAVRRPQVELSVTTDPRTTVHFAGRRLGPTPLNTKVPKGTVTLVFRNRNLGLNATRQLKLVGSRISTQFVFRKGKLALNPKQPCKVFVDGKAHGTTPLPPITLYEGHHTVLLQDARSGRRVFYRRVLVNAGKTTWVPSRGG